MVVAKKKILTLDNLIRRKMVMVNWCCMCVRDGELIDHLLVHCSIAREVWSSSHMVWHLLCFPDICERGS